MKTVGGPFGGNRLRWGLEKICRCAFRSRLAPAQRLAAISALIDLSQKYPVAVRFLRGTHHPTGAIDAHHLTEDVLHRPGQSLLNSGRSEERRVGKECRSR